MGSFAVRLPNGCPAQRSRPPRGATPLRDELLRAASTQGGVRAKLVVVVVPVTPEIASVANAPEAVLVEELVADASVQALSECVLHGLSGSGELVLNPVGVGPGIKRFASEFRSVVGTDSGRLAVSSDCPV